MPDTPEINERVAKLLADGDTSEACELIIQTHGQAIFGMLIGVLHDEDRAQDVFQHFSIELWKSLDRFQGRSSVYTWSYVIARRAISAHLDKDRRTPEVQLRTAQEKAIVARWTRTITDEWHKTETKFRFRELCEGLPEEDRMLVMLRIGEKMPWNQIVEIVAEDDIDTDEAKRESARLRKKFERVKDKLRDAMADAVD